LGNAEQFIEQVILIVTDYYLILLKCLIGEHYNHVKYIPIMNILCNINYKIVGCVSALNCRCSIKLHFTSNEKHMYDNNNII